MVEQKPVEGTIAPREIRHESINVQPARTGFPFEFPTEELDGGVRVVREEVDDLEGKGKS